MKHDDFDWTEERVDLLKKLWAEGHSCSQVAAELGGGLSRNAVIGKIHRLGLAGRAKAMPVRAATPAHGTTPRSRGNGVAVAARIAERKIAARPGQPVLAEPVEGTPAEVVPTGQRCTLLELSSKKCRWPIGDPNDAGFSFCGATPMKGIPYCAGHARMAYNFMPTQKRRDYRPRI